MTVHHLFTFTYVYEYHSVLCQVNLPGLVQTNDFCPLNVHFRPPKGKVTIHLIITVCNDGRIQSLEQKKKVVDAKANANGCE